MWKVRRTVQSENCLIGAVYGTLNKGGAKREIRIAFVLNSARKDDLIGAVTIDPLLLQDEESRGGSRIRTGRGCIRVRQLRGEFNFAWSIGKDFETDVSIGRRPGGDVHVPLASQ